MSSQRPWTSPYPSKIIPSLIRKWQKSIPTPFYVYDLTTLQQRAQEVKTFPHPQFSHFTPRYAIKANPNQTLIKEFDRMGIHFDASSAFEVERLLKIGVSPPKIMLTAQQVPTHIHPYKQWFKQGVIFNATSLRQLKWYGQVCPKSEISLRINPGFGSGMNVKTNVGGKESGFGIWHAHHIDIYTLIEKFQLTVKRIHTHVGSGSNLGIWEEVTKSSLNLLKHFPTADILNIGGGFKVGRHPQENSANLFVIGKKVTKLMERFSKQESRVFDVEVEPGTYYVAESGLLVSQVEDIIATGTKNQKHFIKLNCGMNDFIRPTLYHSRHHIDILPSAHQQKTSPSLKSKTEKQKHYVVIGHCCESGDQISQHGKLNHESDKATLAFSPPKIGDLAIVHGVGAYGSAMSSHYNSFPLIAEYLYTGKELKLIRRAETLDDILQKEV